MSTRERVVITCDKCQVDMSDSPNRRTIILDGRQSTLDLCEVDDKEFSEGVHPWIAMGLQTVPENQPKKQRRRGKQA